MDYTLIWTASPGILHPNCRRRSLNSLLRAYGTTMAARESRDKKEVTRFAPEKAIQKKEPKDLLYEVGPQMFSIPSVWRS